MKIQNSTLAGTAAMLLLGAITLPVSAATVPLNNTSDSGYVRAAGTSVNTTPIIGLPNSAIYNGVVVFQMPSLSLGEVITDAALKFIVSSGSSMYGANTDIWSLGLFTTPTFSTSMYIASNTDATTGHVKLVDNFITSGAALSSTLNTTSTQNTTIASYIQNLYTTLGNANVAGKYLLIRINPDAAPTSGSFRFASPTSTTTNTLTLTTAVTVIPEPATAAMGAGLLAMAGLRRRRREA